jgi:hypothetical protein
MRGPPTGSRTSLSSKVLLAAPAAWIGGPRVMSLAGAVITLLALYRLRSRADRRLLFRWRRLRSAAMQIAVPLTAVTVWNGWTELYALAPFLLWLLLRDQHPRWGVLCLAVALGDQVHGPAGAGSALALDPLHAA